MADHALGFNFANLKKIKILKNKTHFDIEQQFAIILFLKSTALFKNFKFHLIKMYDLLEDVRIDMIVLDELKNFAGGREQKDF